MNCGIYKIENEESGKIYIGSSRDLSERIRSHKANLRNNNHNNPHLQNSWNVHGSDTFTFEILLYCSKDNLKFYEQRALDKYESYDRDIGYNIRKEAFNMDMPDEVCEKISNSRQGMEFSEEHKENLSKALTDREITDKWRNKISETMKEFDSYNFPDQTGEKHHNSKLTKEEVKEIKRNKDDYLNVELAEKYDVSQCAISDIIHERTWTHVEVDSE